MSDDLRIGLAPEDETLGLKLLPENGVVLDDAVVDDGHVSVAAEMGMGIGVGGAAVSGPARVADAMTARAGSSARSLTSSAMRPARLRTCNLDPASVAKPALS